MKPSISSAYYSMLDAYEMVKANIETGFYQTEINEQHYLDFMYKTKDVKEICNKVFNGKKYVLRTIEVFSDAVNINVESMTDDSIVFRAQWFSNKQGKNGYYSEGYI